MAAMTDPTPPPSSSATIVSREGVEKAVKALLSWRETKSESEKPQLLEEDEFIYLILTLKKIPPKGRTNPFKIPLPHPIHAADSTELCLIMDDRLKSGLSKGDAKKKIKAESIPVSKVIKLTKLRSDYRPFEAKRKLADSYDMFFADKRIIPLLPKLLGKHFFKKKKVPVPVDLNHKNWKEQIERACGSAMLFLKTGTCSVLRVGRLSMEGEEIVENVMAAIEGVAEVVPKKWGNVRSFNLKLSESLALPVYQAVPEVKLKIDGLRAVEEEVKVGEEEEVAAKGKGSNEKKKKASKKGRIHEVKYMDSVGEVLDDDDNGDLEMGDGESKESDEMGSGGKKRKKDGKGKIKKENGEALLKKSVKGRKDNVKAKQDDLDDDKDDGDLEMGDEMASGGKKRKQDKVKSKENGEALPKKATKAKKGGLATKGGEESGGKKELKKSSNGDSKNVAMKVKGGKTKKRSLAAE